MTRRSVLFMAAGALSAAAGGERSGPSITLRRAGERGHANHGWLDTHHTFSFSNYYDPKHMGYRSLRVINEDRVIAGEGFPTHPHRDMEIFTYVLSGALEHKDSMGNGSVIRPGDVQRMSAGTGVTHSEYNPSREEGVHFLQIWILPEAKGLTPSYEQKRFEDAEKKNRLRLVASRDGAEGSVILHQDVRIYASLLEPGARLEHTLPGGRYGWIHVVRGALTLNGLTLASGDGAAIEGEGPLVLEASEASEVLLFDLN